MNKLNIFISIVALNIVSLSANAADKYVDQFKRKLMSSISH